MLEFNLSINASYFLIYFYFYVSWDWMFCNFDVRFTQFAHLSEGDFF